MLVLSRKLGERIVLPSAEITITVLSLRGNQVSLGIDAPRAVAVHRSEVWQRLQQAKTPQTK
ncbi:MAG: carbon storage regulator CsrA [Planctomycetia bacterium]|nr:carbon storage regulator CsrA [Planctomycetia bacterium]